MFITLLTKCILTVQKLSSDRPDKARGDCVPNIEIIHARKEYECHDCSAPILPGEMYFHRYSDFTILCMACKRARSERWRKLRDTSEKEERLFADLRRQPQGAGYLNEKYGRLYISLIRKLKMKGATIWRKRVGMRIYYRLEEDKDESWE